MNSKGRTWRRKRRKKQETALSGCASDVTDDSDESLTSLARFFQWLKQRRFIVKQHVVTPRHFSGECRSVFSFLPQLLLLLLSRVAIRARYCKWISATSTSVNVSERSLTTKRQFS